MVSFINRKKTNSHFTKYIFVFITIIFLLSFLIQFFFSIQSEKTNIQNKFKHFVSKNRELFINSLKFLDPKKLEGELNKTHSISGIKKVHLSSYIFKCTL